MAGVEQIVLVADVAVKGGLGDAQPLGNVIERGAVTAAAIEDLGGLANDRLALYLELLLAIGNGVRPA